MHSSFDPLMSPAGRSYDYRSWPMLLEYAPPGLFTQLRELDLRSFVGPNSYLSELQQALGLTRFELSRLPALTSLKCDAVRSGNWAAELPQLRELAVTGLPLPLATQLPPSLTALLVGCLGWNVGHDPEAASVLGSLTNLKHLSVANAPSLYQDQLRPVLYVLAHHLVRLCRSCLYCRVLVQRVFIWGSCA